MARVEIYTSMFCGYCAAAKRLLQQKGVEFEETDVTMNPAEKAKMVERANGGRTVPQIFIDGAHVGGCDDLFALDQAGALDARLGIA